MAQSFSGSDVGRSGIKWMSTLKQHLLVAVRTEQWNFDGCDTIFAIELNRYMTKYWNTNWNNDSSFCDHLAICAGLLEKSNCLDRRSVVVPSVDIIQNLRGRYVAYIELVSISSVWCLALKKGPGSVEIIILSKKLKTCFQIFKVILTIKVAFSLELMEIPLFETESF